MNMNVFDILNILLVIYILCFVFKNNDTLSNFTKIKKTKVIKTVDNNNIDNSQKEIDNAILQKRLQNRDANVLNNPLVAPEQRHEGRNYVKIEKAMMINEHTRGEPENYQVVGLLYKDGADKKYQLFGRRIYPGSPDWEYFIGGRDSGGLDYKYPLDTRQEIYDGTTITNPMDGETYNVKIYNYDKPRYIPYITD
tara:strand:- start:2778 stop:3362 length:585 start_codon:yes stop_codon:yes gene_type:complete